MFHNRRVVFSGWKVQNVVVTLAKRSNIVGPRFPSALLKARISLGLSHVQRSSTSRCSLSKESHVKSRYICICSQFCQGTTSRGLTSTNWPVLTECVKQRTKHKRGKNLESSLNPSSMTNIFLSKMEHTTTKSPIALNSLKRKHSADATDSVVEMKPDEMLAGMVAAESEAEVESNQSTNGAGARPLGSVQNCDNHYREQLLCHRPWEITPKGKQFYSSYGDLSHTVCEFSIASYNVLAQNLLEENYYLYGSCKSKWLAWNFRKKLLMSELKYRNPDILCLQEVNEDHYDTFFEPQLQVLGYSGIYKKRTGQRQDGCATFFKSDKFDCLLAVPVEYLTPKVPVLDRDNVALVLLLQPKHCTRSIDAAVCIANTHLLFNPRRGDVKLAQLMLLFSAIDKLVYKESTSSELVYHPVVVCGDFNLEPHSNLYNFVRAGSLDCDGLVIRKLSGQELDKTRGSSVCLDREFLGKAAGVTDQCQYLVIAEERQQKALAVRPLSTMESTANFGSETVEDMPPPPISRDVLSQGSGRITHRLGLRSVYDHVRRSSLTNKDEIEVTTYHGSACCTVDYIFYSSAGKRERKKRRPGVEHSGGCHLELMSRLRLLSSSEMEFAGKLPNELNASDHTLLMAKFSFKL